MTSQRWRQLNRLFHSALMREPNEREAFVAESCKGDVELREELESLIAHHERSKSFIEQPAYEIDATTLLEDDDDLTGKSIGAYEILAKLGSGGMGVVYLAFDSQLARKVALKFLQPQLTNDKGRVQRFRQEARAASALNHPNILTIFEVGEADGRQYLATEFVDGHTLRELMKSGTLKLVEALDIAMQIASALSAAHAAGIVHRDIKPENIMVRPDAYLKVLDFGVAKLTETPVTHPDAVTLVNTEQGIILGTVQYMSPEQTRGLAADPRSDIWSLGVILYEMVTGHPPFVGATRSDLIATILEREPLPLESQAEVVPAALDSTVTRALTKDRDERYQTVEELLTDLRQIKQRLEIETATGASHTDASKAQGAVESENAATSSTADVSAGRVTSSAEYIISEIKQHKRGVAIILAIFAIAGTGIAFRVYKSIWGNKSAAAFQTMSLTKLTTSGSTRGAAISPDGKYVAYVKDDVGQRSLWLRQVGTTSDIQIAPRGDYGDLIFSRDGIYLYYRTFGGDLHRMPVLGGAKSLLVRGLSSITFSPDAKRLAFLRNDYPSQGESSLLAANLDGTGEQTIASRREPDSFGGTPAWSPDGKVIACAAQSTNGQGMSVVEVQVESGAQRTMTSQRWLEVNDLEWFSDGSGLLVLATDQSSLVFAQKIWQLSYPGGEARRLTNDFNNYEGLSLTADSRMLVTVQEGQAAHIWLATDGESSRAKQITSRAGRYFGLSWTPNGKLVYASDASGNWDIWIMGADGEGKQLTVNASANLLPSVSRDGRYIFFTSNRSGPVNIWRMDADGGNPKQLTYGNIDHSSSCSPDGKWVVYQRENSGMETLWKVPVDGGNPVQLTDRDAGNPVFSPDGKLMVCSYSPKPGEWKVAIISSEGGQPTKLFDIPTPFLFEPGSQWSSDGRALIFHVNRDGVSNLWSQPVEGGSPKQLTDFKSEKIFSFALSRDGKQLAVARGVETGDIVLMTDPK